MKINFGYGDTSVALDVPDKNLIKLIEPAHEASFENSQTLKTAFSQLKRTADKFEGQRVCLMTADATRDMPLKDILPDVFDVLKKAREILVMICTGTHKADSPANLALAHTIADLVEASKLGNIKIHVHDCFKDKLTSAGTTVNGTPIEYNSLVDDIDLFLILSDIKCHYFAGYSNPVKNFVPGICSYKTAEKNHSLALLESSTYGVHPWHELTHRQDNPLACDQLEGFEMIRRNRPVYAFATISSSGSIQWSAFGPVAQTTSDGFTKADELNTYTVPKADHMIVSPGGDPNDIDLYIAQRALELTKAAVKDGGEILFISACPGGVGESHTLKNFYDKLTKPLEEILNSKEAYQLFSHKPYKFAHLIKRLSAIWVMSEIPEEILSAAHLVPTQDPQQIIDKWIQDKPSCQILAINGANKVALYSQPQ